MSVFESSVCCSLISALLLLGQLPLSVTSQGFEGVTFAVGSLGLIRGTFITTLGRSPRNFTQFLGIPYGHPPTRFQPSTLKEDRLASQPNEIFNATSFGFECPQPFPENTGSEDCLFLNVFTPKVTPGPHSDLLPVIVYVHGAAFVDGNANPYTGARLLNRDVVLVSFNYRLGVFGFLNLNLPETSGNAALYDAYVCLEWVQKFIHNFGGDASRVTLAGQSSGSAMVSHMLLSPRSPGLFHRAVAASGSALDVWATSTDPLEAAMTVATYAGCYAHGTPLNISEVHEWLLTKNQTELINAQNTFQFLDRRAGGLGFGAVTPSVQLPFSNSLITSNPQAILEASAQLNVPLMMSATREDGGFVLRLVLEGFILPNQLENNTSFLSNDLIPVIMGAYGINDMNHAMANVYQQLYLKDEIVASGNFSLMAPGLIDLLGAMFFKSGAHRTTGLHGRLNNSTYLYSFEFEGEFTQQPDSVPFPGGVAHSDDLIYLFNEGDLNEEETLLSEVMVDYWVNFATSGNPNVGDSQSGTDLPEWKSVGDLGDRSQSFYLRIHNEEIRSLTNYPKSWVIHNKEEVIRETCPSSARIQITSPLALFVLVALVFIN